MAPRARLIAALLVVLSIVALAHYTQVWASIPAQQARTSDFAGTYVAATLWREGRPASMYDVPAEEAVMAASGAPGYHLYIPFENPPLAAVVASPLSLLGADSAYRAWSLLQLAMLVAAVAVVVRAAPRPSAGGRLPILAIATVGIAGVGGGLLLVEGQWDGLPALGLALAYAGWRSGRSLAPGFVLGFTAALAKPHLVLGLLGFMAGRRDWRGLASAAMGAGVVGAAGLVAAGPQALEAFIGALLQPANSPTSQMQGASGLFGSTLGGGLAPYGLALLTGAAAILTAAWLGAVSRRRRDLLEPAVLGATALSLFASPHLLGHDLTVLAPAVVAALLWCLRRENGAPAGWPGPASLAILGGWAAVNIASLFDLGKSGIAFPGRATPWVLLLCCAACVALVLRSARRDGRSAPRAASAASPSLAARY
ncbi:MAG: DUF2029 domain-containing protein [Candidatus Dormibacteraeota bacterium]|nr:DUF2029 domain-containing protein [Candidatus Dormibacteraeota bacterium]